MSIPFQIAQKIADNSKVVFFFFFAILDGDERLRVGLCILFVFSGHCPESPSRSKITVFSLHCRQKCKESQSLTISLFP